MGPHQGIEEHVAEQAMAGIDDEDLVELVRQVGFVGVAHHVDGLPCRPERRHGDDRRLHQTTGRFVREVERALQGRSVDRRHGVEDLVLILLVQILQQRDGVVAFEILDVERDGRVRQLFEDVLADAVVHLGEGGEVEVAPHDGDKLGTPVRRQRLDERAEVGLVDVTG